MEAERKRYAEHILLTTKERKKKIEKECIWPEKERKVK